MSAVNIATPINAPFQATVKIERWTVLQLLVTSICFLINMIDGMDVMIMSYVAPALAHDWAMGPENLGVIFSAGLGGMMIGCLLIAPLADLAGRRPLILASLTIMTIGMIASGFASTITVLFIARFLVGIGIGAVLASMAAITAEYAPEHHRSFAVGFVQGGYPLGAVLTGLASVWAIPAFGWRNVLLGVGIGSCVILPFAFFTLPESLDYLLKRQPKAALRKINRILGRLGQSEIMTLPPKAPHHGLNPGVDKLFREDMWVSTLLLWCAIVAGFMVLYFIISWIPKLAIEAGLDTSNAIIAGSIYNIGACAGTTGMGWLTTRFKLQYLTPVFMILAAVFLVVFGSVSMPVSILLGVAFLIGMTLQGGFNSFYPLAASLYPAEIRSTGIGWAVGVGRGGAILGPLLGGYLLSIHMPLPTLFTIYAAPLLVAGALGFVVARIHNR